ncbi:MAG: hypothetical protein HC866_17775 [Leptolyngbyaceae cyanobacterium RU_5_1]|nr:hypothetical protein [Leptolyngbyaceae cyanobacterium RU_5_1]
MTQGLPPEPINSESEATLPDQAPESSELEPVSSGESLQVSAESESVASEIPSLTAAEPVEASPAEPVEASSEVLPQASVEPQAAVPAELSPSTPAQPAALPQEATPQSDSTQIDNTQSQTLQTLKRFWQETQPKLKAGTIKALKTTIQVLQWTVERLETEPRSPAAKAPSTQAPPGSGSPPVQSPPSSSIHEFREKLLPLWQRVQEWWGVVLPKIRAILPESANQKLSDPVLTGAIAGVLILLLWATSSVLSSQPPRQVATAPPSQTAPAQKTGP